MDESSWFAWITALHAGLTAEVSLVNLKPFLQLIFALSVGVSVWEGLIPTYFNALVEAITQESDKIKNLELFKKRPEAQKVIDKDGETIEEKGEKHQTRLANIIKWGRIFGALLAGLILLLLWVMGMFPELEYKTQRWVAIVAVLGVMCGFYKIFSLAKLCLSEWKGDLTRYEEIHKMADQLRLYHDREASGS